MMSTSPDTSGRVWVPAPLQSAPVNTGSIQGVWAMPGEEIEWSWVHLQGGQSYVNGYRVKNKGLPEPHEESKS